jgi:hypothetical protein
MASSFINFNENGFWGKDAFVESFQLLLFEEIVDQYGSTIDWLNSYRREIALQSLPLIYGGMSMCLDDTLINQSRKEIFLNLIEIIKNKIVSDEQYLTGKHLNGLRRDIRLFLISERDLKWDEKEVEKQVKDGAFGDELPKANYLHGFELLCQLIKGYISYKADSPIDYWNE